MQNSGTMQAIIMFDHANGFYLCAELCEKAFDSKTLRWDLYSTPSSVNLAFACEIYLKTLLFCIDNEKPIKQHRLNDLIALLPEDVKDSIMQSVYMKFPLEKNAWGESYLNLVSDTFTEWRYSYEKYQLSCEIGYLRALADSLKEECAHRIFGISWDEYIGINIDSR